MSAAEKSEQHFHKATCWDRYEPCGEHHGHTYWCGGGELNPSCPEYERDLKFQIRIILSRINGWNHGDDDLRRIEDCARKLNDENLLTAVKTLRKWK